MPLEVIDEGADFAPCAYWSAPVPLADALAAPLAPAELAIHVYANQGRWIAECPDCRGAQIASATDYRFMCTVCANVAVEGLWRPVIWPEEHAEIDAVLADRPQVNQNWLPGETVADLEAENLAAEAVA